MIFGTVIGHTKNLWQKIKPRSIKLLRDLGTTLLVVFTLFIVFYAVPSGYYWGMEICSSGNPNLPHKELDRKIFCSPHEFYVQYKKCGVSCMVKVLPESLQVIVRPTLYWEQKRILEGTIDRGVAQPSCFTEDTLVWTPQGNKVIATLSPGDVVFSRDDMSGKIQEARVENILRRMETEIVTLNNSLHVTPEHPMAMFEEGEIIWKKAGQLKVGECLVDSLGSCERITLIKSGVGAPTPVINLSVSAPHNFFVFVKNIPILVHNKTVPCVGCPIINYPSEYNDDIHRLDASNAIFVGKIRSLEWHEYGGYKSTKKEQVYDVEVVLNIKGDKDGILRLAESNEKWGPLHVGSTMIFLLPKGPKGEGMPAIAPGAQYFDVSGITYGYISEDPSLSTDKLRLLAEKYEIVIKLQGLLKGAPYFNGQPFAKFFEQRLQEIETQEK